MKTVKPTCKDSFMPPIRRGGCKSASPIRINQQSGQIIMPNQWLIPTAGSVDSSNASGGWYRAPGWRAAARRTKTHTGGHSLGPLV
jgi:hypothetical protein